MAIATGDPITIGQLHTDLWVPVNAQTSLQSSRANHQLIDCNLDGYWTASSFAADVADNSETIKQSYIPATDIRLVAIQILTAGSGLNPSTGTISWTLSSAAQGTLVTNYVDVAVTQGEKIVHTPFTDRSIVIGAGDTLTFKLTATDFTFGSFYIRPHLLFKTAWVK
jgi:hypothetical protein